MSTIEWTEVTWNPTRGCSRVSEGCRNCYAERFAAARHSRPGQAYHGLVSVKSKVSGLRYEHPGAAGSWTDPRWTGRVDLVPEALEIPLRRRKPTTFFVDSMSDLFHEAVPFEFIAAVYGVMAACPQHRFQVLTKRAPRMLEFYEWLAAQQGGLRLHVCMAALDSERQHHPDGDADPDGPWPLPNVTLMVSVEDQRSADERIPYLLQAPAAVRGVSMEPLLGAVDLRHLPFPSTTEMRVLDALTAGSKSDTPWGLDWVIVGGESGPGARPMHPDWARSIRDQCQAAGVAFFFKQWGAWAPRDEEERDAPYGEFHRGSEFIESCMCSEGDAGAVMYRLGKKRAGRALDGRTWDEMPPAQVGGGR